MATAPKVSLALPSAERPGIRPMTKPDVSGQVQGLRQQAAMEYQVGDMIGSGLTNLGRVIGENQNKLRVEREELSDMKSARQVNDLQNKFQELSATMMDSATIDTASGLSSNVSAEFQKLQDAVAQVTFFNPKVQEQVQMGVADLGSRVGIHAIATERKYVNEGKKKEFGLLSQLVIDEARLNSSRLPDILKNSIPNLGQAMLDSGLFSPAEVESHSLELRQGAVNSAIDSETLNILHEGTIKLKGWKAIKFLEAGKKRIESFYGNVATEQDVMQSLLRIGNALQNVQGQMEAQAAAMASRVADDLKVRKYHIDRAIGNVSAGTSAYPGMEGKESVETLVQNIRDYETLVKKLGQAGKPTGSLEVDVLEFKEKLTNAYGARDYNEKLNATKVLQPGQGFEKAKHLTIFEKIRLVKEDIEKAKRDGQGDIVRMLNVALNQRLQEANSFAQDPVTAVSARAMASAVDHAEKAFYKGGDPTPMYHQELLRLQKEAGAPVVHIMAASEIASYKNRLNGTGNEQLAAMQEIKEKYGYSSHIAYQALKDVGVNPMFAGLMIGSNFNDKAFIANYFAYRKNPKAMEDLINQKGIDPVTSRVKYAERITSLPAFKAFVGAAGIDPNNRVMIDEFVKSFYYVDKMVDDHFGQSQSLERMLTKDHNHMSISNPTRRFQPSGSTMTAMSTAGSWISGVFSGTNNEMVSFFYPKGAKLEQKVVAAASALATPEVMEHYCRRAIGYVSPKDLDSSVSKLQKNESVYLGSVRIAKDNDGKIFIQDKTTSMGTINKALALMLGGIDDLSNDYTTRQVTPEQLQKYFQFKQDVLLSQAKRNAKVSNILGDPNSLHLTLGDGSLAAGTNAGPMVITMKDVATVATAFKKVDPNFKVVDLSQMGRAIPGLGWYNFEKDPRFSGFGNIGAARSVEDSGSDFFRLLKEISEKEPYSAIPE